MTDVLFWWTGCIVWVIAAVLAVISGLPSGDAHKGVTVLAFYGFGPVIWRELPENRDTFNRLKQVGYHFWRIGGNWHLGWSLPTWLSRRLLARNQRHDNPTNGRPQG